MRADGLYEQKPETDTVAGTADLVPPTDGGTTTIDRALGSLKMKELRELILLLEAVASDISPVTLRPLYARRDLIRRRRRR